MSEETINPVPTETAPEQQPAEQTPAPTEEGKPVGPATIVDMEEPLKEFNAPEQESEKSN